MLKKPVFHSFILYQAAEVVPFWVLFSLIVDVDMKCILKIVMFQIEETTMIKTTTIRTTMSEASYVFGIL